MINMKTMGKYLMKVVDLEGIEFYLGRMIRLYLVGVVGQGL
jgi:hypothetical protein